MVSYSSHLTGSLRTVLDSFVQKHLVNTQEAHNNILVGAGGEGRGGGVKSMPLSIASGASRS